MQYPQQTYPNTSYHSKHLVQQKPDYKITIITMLIINSNWFIIWWYLVFSQSNNTNKSHLVDRPKTKLISLQFHSRITSFTNKFNSFFKTSNSVQGHNNLANSFRLHSHITPIVRTSLASNIVIYQFEGWHTKFAHKDWHISIII